MDQDRLDRWLGLFLVALALGWTGIVLQTIPAASDQAAAGPRAFPLVLGAILAALGLFMGCSAALRLARGAPAGEPVERPNGREIRVAGAIFAILLLYGFLMSKVGFVLATPFVVVLALRVSSRAVSWLMVIALALGITAGCYVVFEVLLTANLPRGSWLRFP